MQGFGLGQAGQADFGDLIPQRQKGVLFDDERD